MCIIIIKEREASKPSHDILKTCFQNNPDGAGIAVIHDGYVSIHKGFMRLDEYVSFVDKFVHPSDLAIYHFRIGTSGGNTPQNTHPFPIADTVKELKALTLKSRFAFIHNGILGHGTDTLSDTQLFIKDVLFNMRNKLDDLHVQNQLKSLTTGSRTVTLDAHKNLVIKTGNWITDRESGLMFSNSTYVPYTNASFFDGFKDCLFDHDIEWNIVCPMCSEEVEIDCISQRHYLYECASCGCVFDDDLEPLKF